MIFLLCSIVVLGLGFWGLWMAVQKRLRLIALQLKESFQAVSFEAMERNSRVFLDLAKTSLEKYQETAKTDLESRQSAILASMQPLKESLKQIDQHQRELEQKRIGSYAALTQQLGGMILAEKELRKEMNRLTQSLRSPQIRGSWGQIHLRRVIELAGMVNHCDFYEQQSVTSEGKAWRPDLLIRLPGDRQIIIDAKTPLNAYLDATDTGDDEVRKKKLMEHAASLKRHMKELSAKEYWKQFETAPEYVILFLPAEAFYSAALQADPSLVEIGIGKNVLIATPTTLIAILRAVALTWKQESISKNAREIAQIGQDLYHRIFVFCEHWNKVGKNLNGAVEAFNQSGASLESRVLVSARKLKEIGKLEKPIPDLVQLDQISCLIKNSGEADPNIFHN
ncbi:MAG TPA: DNA recombination protein RmuC [Chlamydiales bacterium]|nr:DNA recombination protein RmuC [Chlamydiales bacterium]